MRRQLIVGTLMLILFGHAGFVGAQTCYGNSPISSASPLAVGANVDIYSGARGFSGLATLGNDKLVSNVGVGHGSYTDADGSWNFVFADIAPQLALGSGGKIKVCPNLYVAPSFGPNYPPDETFKSTQVGLGVAMGFVAAQSGTTSIVPSASVSFTTIMNKDVFQGNEQTWTVHTSSLGLGVGFVFNEAFSVQPAVFIPMSGPDPKNVSYQIAARLGIGQR